MTSDPLVGKILADRFEILERIGDGGTGVVYRAKQLSVDRIIAVKVLGAHVSTDPQWMKRFQNEARAACKLEHPNTVRVLDFGQTREGLLFIAMEYLHGRSLRSEIERAGRMPASRVLQIVAQVSASLSEAHSQGIIHRDIKPDNVMLVDLKGGGDMVKVLDFSVAKSDAPDAQLTRAGVVFGTPAYMSPEQGRGVPLGPTSDLYAVGIVAYEMLMGRPPFEGAIPSEVVMMHLRKAPPPVNGVPPKVAALVMRTLEKDPLRRPQSAAELEQQCQKLLVELSGFLPSIPAGRVSTTSPPGGEPAYRPQTQQPHTQALPSEGGHPPPAEYPAAKRAEGGPAGTMVLPESGLPLGAGLSPVRPSSGFGGAEGSARRAASEDVTHAGRDSEGASGLFWLAWALIGMAAGLGAHFWLIHRASG